MKSAISRALSARAMGTALLLVGSCLGIVSTRAFAQELVRRESLGGRWTWSDRSIRSAQREFGITETTEPRRFEILAERIHYRTLNSQGLRTTASALIRFRKDILQSSHPLKVISYQHSTRVRRDDCPSENPLDPESLAMMLHFVANGWLVIMPDYLGMGVNSDGQSYLDAKVQAQTVRDSLAALEQWIQTKSEHLTLQWNGDIILAGYSQGAHTTVSTLRLLESTTSRYRPQAAIAMAGPLSLSRATLARAFTHRSSRLNLFLGLTLFGLARNPHYGIDLDYTLRTPWNKNLEQLFRGEMSFEEVADQLPQSMQELLSEHAWNQLRQNPSASPLFRALTEQDLTEFTPRARVLLVHSQDDDTVPFENSKLASELWRSRGANVELHTLTGYSHFRASVPSFAAMAEFLKRSIIR